MYIFREDKGENFKFYVELRNLESMTKTKKKPSEILADDKTYFLGKSHSLTNVLT